MLSNLKDYLTLLRAERDLVEISCAVDPNLEAAEIHRRVVEAQGPALLFKNIKGASYPLVTNLFGTPKRIELAFGKKPKQVLKEIAELPHTMLPPSLAKLWSKRTLISSMFKLGFTKPKSAGAYTSLEQPPKLSKLPLLKTWLEDGGEFVTLPLVYTEDPRNYTHNLGMYRLQRFDDACTGFHAQIGKGAGFHLAQARELGVSLPVNVHIGGPPALLLSAIAPLPENVPELLLASLIRGSKVRMLKNPWGDLPLIDQAEFVLVGEVNPLEQRAEGPFGDHYGYYSLQHDYPVFRVKGMLRAKDPICTATVVGKPKQEDFFLGDYLQELLSPLFPVVMPAVQDLWSYGETGFHSLSAAVVKQRYKREAMASAFRILGEGQLSLTKFLLVLDRQHDLRDFKGVLEYILERADFRSDLFVFSNLAMDTLDYTGPKANEGSKGVLLGCGNAIRNLPGEFSGPLPQGIRKVFPFCRGCLVLEGSPYGERRDLGEEILKSTAFDNWPLLVLVDDLSKATASTSAFLWTTFTRFEPAADIRSRRQEIVRNHIAHHDPILIDARMKPWYPAELEVDPHTKRLVDRRWGEYFGD